MKIKNSDHRGGESIVYISDFFEDVKVKFCCFTYSVSFDEPDNGMFRGDIDRAAGDCFQAQDRGDVYNHSARKAFVLAHVLEAQESTVNHTVLQID